MAEDFLFHSWKNYTEKLNALAKRFHFPVQTIGQSYLGREIPAVRLGDGKHRVLYVATHHANEWLLGAVLLRFIEAYGKALERNGTVCNINLSFLFHTRSIWVVPVLNPDGMELVLTGNDEHNPLLSRVIEANGGSRDFTYWKANGRGVDLNRNYYAGFSKCLSAVTSDMLTHGAPAGYCGTHPESEPEVLSLCNFIRHTVPFDLILSLHTAGEEIYYSYENYEDARVRNIARILSRLSGYPLAKPKPDALHGGLKDWYLQEYRAPAYTIECGAGETPVPPIQMDKIFERLKNMLFCGAVLS